MEMAWKQPGNGGRAHRNQRIWTRQIPGPGLFWRICALCGSDSVLISMTVRPVGVPWYDEGADRRGREPNPANSVFPRVRRPPGDRNVGVPMTEMPGQNDPGLVALVMLLRFHGVGADPAQI